MIPRIIHYCWFGGEKSAKVKKCIETWEQNLPDYQIIEWNEENFDVDQNLYTRDAFKAKRYAFVSDVARIKALYEYGGIYLDTDVVVYKDFDSILCYRCVFGFEEEQYIATSFMACESHFPLMKQFLDLYNSIPFYDDEGNIIPGTNVGKLTDLLIGLGLKRNNQFQELESGIVVYPQEYFSPYDYGNCIHQNTEKTICEHLFFVSWLPWPTRLKKVVKRVIGPVLGKKNMNKLRLKYRGMR